MEFSETLKYLRNSTQCTQKKLAEYLGLSANTVCEWEKNRSEPSIQTIRKLAEYFDVSADYLLGLEDDFGAITATAPTVMGDNYSLEERQLIEDYQKLNTHSKKYLQDTLKMLLETSSGSAQNKRN